MILLELKQKTKEYHDTIDKHMDILNKEMSLEDYKGLLQRFWGFYLPVESQIASTKAWGSYSLEFERRRKLPLLTKDLITVDVSEATLKFLPICSDLPGLATLPQVLGCMYVLEGATLGGQIIARHIKKLFGFDVEHGCAFFSSYGCDVGPMWKSFGSLVVAYSSVGDAEKVIIRAACETFVKLNKWLLEGDTK